MHEFSKYGLLEVMIVYFLLDFPNGCACILVLIVRLFVVGLLLPFVFYFLFFLSVVYFGCHSILVL